MLIIMAITRSWKILMLLLQHNRALIVTIITYSRFNSWDGHRLLLWETRNYLLFCGRITRSGIESFYATDRRNQTNGNRNMERNNCYGPGDQGKNALVFNYWCSMLVSSPNKWQIPLDFSLKCIVGYSGEIADVVWEILHFLAVSVN